MDDVPVSRPTSHQVPFLFFLVSAAQHKQREVHVNRNNPEEGDDSHRIIPVRDDRLADTRVL